MGSLRFASTLLACTLAAACQTAPDRTIPDPLPETLEWALPEASGGAFLGLEVRENDSGALESLSFDPGVRVHSVTDQSPAAAAGIRVDDVVLTMDAIELAVPEDLEALLSAAEPGALAQLSVQRGDTVFDLDVPLGGDTAQAPAGVREAFVLDPARTRGAWGTAQGAVLVSRADKGPVAGLPLGTRVVTLDGAPIVSGRGLVQRLVATEPGSVVRLGVVEPGREGTRTEKIRLLDEGRRVTRFSIPVLATYDATPDRTRESFVLLDLYLISLFRFTRDGTEKSYSFLRFFQFAGGVGELEE